MPADTDLFLPGCDAPASNAPSLLGPEVDQSALTIAREIREQQVAFAQAATIAGQRFVSAASRPMDTREQFIEETAQAARLAVLNGNAKAAAPLYKLVSEAMSLSSEVHVHTHLGPNARLAALTDAQLDALLAQPAEVIDARTDVQPGPEPAAPAAHTAAG